MNITSRQYAQALYESLLLTPSSGQSQALDNFVRLLAEHGRLAAWPAIEEELIRYDQKIQGKIAASAVFAKEDTSRGKTLDALKQVLGKDMEFTRKVDESLLGGVVVETEDQRIDLSVKKQLSNLKKVLSI